MYRKLSLKKDRKNTQQVHVVASNRGEGRKKGGAGKCKGRLHFYL